MSKNEVIDFGLKPVYEDNNVFGDEIAYIKCYDFSKANLSKEHRLHAVTSVASICYNNPKAIGSESLFNRLEQESKGLPSSSFEFIKMLIPESKILDAAKDKPNINLAELNIYRFGFSIYVGGIKHILTNYRAVVYDLKENNIDLTNFYNNENECNYIKFFSYTFKIRMDTNTRAQFVRHRIASYQELSRRYVSGNKVPFSYYISESMSNVTSRYILVDEQTNHSQALDITTKQLHDMCTNHYFDCLKAGVKAQDARRCLPQSMYTDIWVNIDTYSLRNFYNIRSSQHAQWEIKILAESMKIFSDGMALSVIDLIK